MNLESISNRVSNSPAARQWKKAGVRHHHGIAVPLFSLHSKDSPLIGEYPDLISLIHWCKSIGFDTIQLLPLNDTGGDTSPYNAISAFALNPLHLGLSSLPYLDEHPDLIEELRAIPKNNEQTRVNYPEVREVKQVFFKKYFHKTRETIIKSQDYKDFVENSHWLKGYAIYKILKESHGYKSWENWPDEWRNPSQDLLDIYANQKKTELEYEYILQYLCDAQLHAVKKTADANNILLMGDIPILIGRDSADVWLNTDLFLLEYSSGSPPDIYTTEGQNWGSPIYNWQVIAHQNYTWWIDRLKTASRYYQVYRVDHIIGFFRIWAIADGFKSTEGHFIPEDERTWTENGKKILEMMLHNCDMLPIGEDLGVVPPEVRPTLSELGICGTKIIRWQRNWDLDGLYIPLNEYDPLSMTSVSTHDAETLQIWWRDQPMEAQFYAKHKGWEYQPVLSNQYQIEILNESHRSGSLFHINLLQEYLSLFPDLSWPSIETQRVNVPGTISEENWSNRYKPTVEEIIHHKGLHSLMTQMVNNQIDEKI